VNKRQAAVVDKKLVQPITVQRGENGAKARQAHDGELVKESARGKSGAHTPALYAAQKNQRPLSCAQGIGGKGLLSNGGLTAGQAIGTGRAAWH
jgi:hypothetical protein